MHDTLVHAQQRRALRRAVPVECQLVRDRDFALLGRRAIDLSPQGMLVMSEARVLTGEPVIVAFRFPRSPWWFDAEATVARVVHGRRPGDSGSALGIAFDRIEPAVQYFLHTLLQGVPPPVPRRRRRVDYAATIERAMSS